MEPPLPPFGRFWELGWVDSSSFVTGVAGILFTIVALIQVGRARRAAERAFSSAEARQAVWVINDTYSRLTDIVSEARTLVNQKVSARRNNGIRSQLDAWTKVGGRLHGHLSRVDNSDTQKASSTIQLLYRQLDQNGTEPYAELLTVLNKSIHYAGVSRNEITGSSKDFVGIGEFLMTADSTCLEINRALGAKMNLRPEGTR